MESNYRHKDFPEKLRDPSLAVKRASEWQEFRFRADPLGIVVIEIQQFANFAVLE